ncbi:MAG: LysR family transcriptional regulator [Thaumarchaeota archaeon]|nr:LysR family transcriptional regulator [Nitrososphaerota archaeon]
MSEAKPKTARRSLKPTFHLVLENSEKEALLDETDAVLLRRISESDSLTDAARIVGISYRNAWDRLNRLETTLEAKVVETKVGGTKGGETRLTQDGVKLLNDFRRLRKYLFNALEDEDIRAHAVSKSGFRNKFRAKILEVHRGSMTSEIKMVILQSDKLTSIISNEVVDDLGLGEDDEVEAVLKSTGVIIVKKESDLVG